MTFAEELCQTPELRDLLAKRVCERAFLTTFAAAAGAELAEVETLYGMLSTNLHELVHSPQGWTALGRIMVTDPTWCVQLASVH